MFFLLSIAARSASADGVPPTVTINLDDNPSTRWDAIVTQYNQTIWASVALVETSPSYKRLLAAANVLFHNESSSG